MNTNQEARGPVLLFVPYTFEQSLANWADVLDGDADDAAENGGRVSLCVAHIRDIAAHLRGAVRLIEQANQQANRGTR